MSYEEFREQCAAKLEQYKHHVIDAETCADVIRAMPLPELSPVAWDDSRADDIITSLYRRFKDWCNRGFTADDVTWCEVKAEVNQLLEMSNSEIKVLRAENERFRKEND